MSYYVMVCEGKHPVTPIRKGPRKGGWRLGRLLTDPIDQPLSYELDSGYPGTLKAMYSAEAVPLMHDSVRAVLDAAGVSNVQYFDAVVRDPASGKEHNDYKAFNIVGLVACADMEASERMGTSASAMGDTDFHALVIDESRTGGQLLFRLAENISAIVVHERIRQAIEQAGIPGFVFYGPGEWAG